MAEPSTPSGVSDLARIPDIFEQPDSSLIERQNQKKVVLKRRLWQAGCNLSADVTDDASLFRGYFPHETSDRFIENRKINGTKRVKYSHLCKDFT
jgi:hypothetical protein